MNDEAARARAVDASCAVRWGAQDGSCAVRWGGQCAVRWGAQDGFGLLWFHAFLVWLLLVLTIAVIDVGAYFVAAARAQNAADAAALAAVSVDASLRPVRETPPQAARRVVAAVDGVLERCECRPARGRARVEVSVEVPGLVIPRVIGMQRVTASADAHLVPPLP